MAKLNIDLTIGSGTWYDGHGADISSETAIVGEVKMTVLYENNTVVAEVTYFISEAARNNGGQKTPILYVDQGTVNKASDRFSVTVANNATFGAATLTQAITFIKDKVEEVFGLGSTTIVT